MAAGLGKLTVDLAANISRFERSLNKAERIAQKRSAGIARTFARLAGGIGAALAGAGFIKAVDSALDYADAIGKTSDKLGIATDSLQEYRFAADQTGVAQNALDVGIQRFTRRLGEAQEGTGVLAKVLDELNIGLTDNEGKFRSTEAVLDDYADAIKNADNEQKQLLLAFKAFDTEGAAMVNTLRAGSEGLNKMRQEARDLGLIMDEELIRTAEETKDQLAILAGVLKTQLSSALIEMAPLIQDATKFLIELTQEVAKFFGGIQSMNADQTIAEIERLTAAIAHTQETLTDKTTADGSAKDALGDMFLPDPETLEAKIVMLEDKLLEAEMRLGAINLRRINEQGDGDGGGDTKNFFTGLTDGEMEYMLQQAIDMEKYMTEWLDSEGAKRIDIERKTQAAIGHQREVALGHAIGLLQRFANDNKAIALLLIGIQTAKAVKDVQIQATAASAQVLAYGQVEAAAHSAMFNYGAAAAAIDRSVVAAASIQSSAALSTGLIIATGVADAAALSGTSQSGAGGTAPGGTYNPYVTTQDTATTFAPDPFLTSESAQGGSITINVNGVITDEIMQDLVVPAIQDAVNDKDIVLFTNDSRQALELQT